MTIIPIYIEPRFNFGDVVEVWRGGNLIATGKVCLRSHGFNLKAIQPSYGILRKGETSFKRMIMADESEVVLAIPTADELRETAQGIAAVIRQNHQAATAELESV